MVLALRAAVLACFVSCGGCGGHSCPALCLANKPAVFQLSCGPTDLLNVALSGVCSVGDAGPSSYLFGPASMSLAIHSSNAGNCHVSLTFATGFSYSADVTFTLQTDTTYPDCHGCSYTVPTQQTFIVDNPSGTCMDAGR